MPTNPRPLSFVTLIVLAAFAAFGAMIPMAVLPDIAHAFHVSVDASDGVMAWYLLGYALAQLLYGPLANWLGRRRALLVGATIALLGSLLSIVMTAQHWFDLYLFSRFWQGLGAGAGLIIAMVMIKDVHEPVPARKIFSRVVLTFSFVPCLAIAVGAALGTHGGWQNLNLVLLGYAVVVLVLTWRLPETLPLHKRVAPSPRALTTSYRHLLSNVAYLKFLIAFGLASAISYTFNGVAPLWVIGVAHISTQTYGYLSVLPGLGLLIGGYISQRLAAQVSAYRFTVIALALMFLAAASMSIGFALAHIPVSVFYGLAVLLFAGQAVVAANAGMAALSYVSDHANGSSLMNALTLLMGSVMVALVGHLFVEHSVSFPLALTVMAMISLGVVAKKPSAQNPR